VMTRTTFKALWVGGGGLLATWLAVSPTTDVPTMSRASSASRLATASEQTAQDLNALATRLRVRTAAVTLRPSTRNPFRFSPPKPATRSSAPRESLVQSGDVKSMSPAALAGPALTLSGMAQTAGKRTAIISSGGQIYVVKEGDSVAGLFTVIAVDPEAVLLRDAAGSELRLGLPQ